MTTAPMITELTNAGWTNGTTITTVSSMRATGSITQTASITQSALMTQEDGEEAIASYYCTPFVAQNSAGFSIFNDIRSLVASLCGMEASTDETVRVR